MSRKKKKKTIFNKIIWFIEYTILKLVETLFFLVGFKIALKIGRFLGKLVSIIDKTHTKRAYEHINIALGMELSEKERKNIIAQSYAHFGMVLVEILYIQRLIKKGLFDGWVEIEGKQNLDEALKKGKGVILAGGHLGNWELCGCYLAMQGYNTNAIARPLDNPLIDKYLNNIRQQTGQKIFPKWGALKESIKAFRKNEIMAMLVDQDARKYGVFVNFFNKPSSTLPTPATLAIKYGVAVVPFYTYRKKGEYKYVLGFEKDVVPVLTDNLDEDIVNMTQQIANSMEKAIRNTPEQWLWMHRRWKTSPEKIEKKLQKMKEEVQKA